MNKENIEVKKPVKWNKRFKSIDDVMKLLLPSLNEPKPKKVNLLK